MEVRRRKHANQIERVADGGHPHLDLQVFIPGLLTVLYNRLSNESSKMYRKWYGIGVTDWRVLAFLGVYGESTAADISRGIALDKAAISRSILLLKKRHLVDGKQFAGRRVGLQLTRTGRERYEEILSFALTQERALLSGFTDGESQFLVNMLHRMLHNLHELVRLTPAGRPGPAGSHPRGR